MNITVRSNTWREAIRQFISHARDNPAVEACGVIWRRGGSDRWRFSAVQNNHPEPEKAFRISIGAMPRGRADIGMICHSHPHQKGPPVASAADIRQQRAGGVPWLIVSGDGAARALDDGRLTKVL